MFLPFSAGSYDYDRYELSPVILQNFYAQPSPELPSRAFRIVPTPGLVNFAATGITGSAGAAFQSDGVLSGDVVVATGTAVRRVASDGTVTTLTGSITRGALAPQFAASQAPELVMVSNGVVYDIGSSAVTSFSWAGPSGGITSVDVIGQRHLYTEAGSGRLWFSDTGDAQTVTQFLTAENDPDGLVCVKVHRDTIYLFGTRTIEAAVLTGAASPVAVFRPGFRVDMGALASRAVCRTRRDVCFVGDDQRVYALGGGNPTPIGNEAITRAISRVALADQPGISLDSYTQGNHEWLKLGLPGVGDYFFDLENQLWHRRKRLLSWESGVGPVVRAFGKVLTLDNAPSGNTALLEMDLDVFTDRGAPVQRIATALVPLEDGEISVHKAAIEVQTGQAVSGESPQQIAISIARDGRSFENPILRDLGGVGQFRHRVVFGPCGVFYPGLTVVRVEISDAAGVALAGIMLNPRSSR